MIKIRRFDNTVKTKHFVSIGVGKLIFFFKLFSRKTVSISITIESIRKGKDRPIRSTTLYRAIDKNTSKKTAIELETESQPDLTTSLEQPAQSNKELQRTEYNRNNYYKKCFEFYEKLFRI